VSSGRQVIFVNADGIWLRKSGPYQFAFNVEFHLLDLFELGSVYAKPYLVSKFVDGGRYVGHGLLVCCSGLGAIRDR
jgi:hypothetical protein